MQRFFLCTILLFITFISKAQKDSVSTKKIKLSVAANIGVTLSTYSPFSAINYGGDVQAQYNLNPEYAVTLSGGFIALSNRFNVGLPTFIPILLGGRYYIKPSVYGSLQAGASIIVQPSHQTFTGTGNGAAFTFAPGIGYQFSNNFDALLKYQAAIKGNITFSFIGLRVAYIF